MVIGLAAAFVSAFLYGAPAALQARASRRIVRGSLWRQVLSGARDPLMLLVVACYLLGAVGHYIAILMIPLYLAQAVVASSLVFTALASIWLLSEWPRPVHWLGLGLLCGGIVLLALASGSVGRSELGRSVTVWLVVALVALVIVAALLVQLDAPRGGSSLGLLSGLAYGFVPIGARALGVLDWNLHTVSTGIVTALFGGLGFGLYSISLARCRVNAATAPLILAQTMLPALVGILLLDDGVRTGWWPVLTLGMVLSLIGAIALSLTAEGHERVLADHLIE